MRSVSLTNDRGLKRILDIMERCSEKVDVKIMSIVLYGARAKGDKTSQSVYEFLVLSIMTLLSINLYCLMKLSSWNS